MLEGIRAGFRLLEPAPLVIRQFPAAPSSAAAARVGERR
jgi:hypothetical protein